MLEGVTPMNVIPQTTLDRSPCLHSRVQPFWRRLDMKRKPKMQRGGKPKTRLGLPDLDQSKAAVIGSLRSPESQRVYTHAIDEFIEWYCSEPRLVDMFGPFPFPDG